MAGESTALQVIETSREIERRFMPVMSVDTAVQRYNAIGDAVTKLMERGEDYGEIPGTKKPTLLKPGAEKLCNLFGLIPRYDQVQTIEDWTGVDHAGEPFFYYRVKCSLWRGDALMGEGEGSCNSWESKYRYRKSERVCPLCGKDTIIKGKAEYGGGWLCFPKKGGCGAKFKEKDPAIEKQIVGRVANPEIHDQVNTVLKMANKRAQVAATLNATGASRFFTQDMEDRPSYDPHAGQSDDIREGHDLREDDMRGVDAGRKPAVISKPEVPEGVTDLWARMKKGKFEALEVLGKLKETCINAFGEVAGDEKYREVLREHIPQEAWDPAEKRPKANGFTDGKWGGEGKKGSAVRFNAMMAAAKDLYLLLEAEAQKRAENGQLDPEAPERVNGDWGVE